MTRIPLALLVVVGAGQVLLAANALAEAAKPLTEKLPAAAQQATEDDGPQPSTLPTLEASSDDIPFHCGFGAKAQT